MNENFQKYKKFREHYPKFIFDSFERKIIEEKLILTFKFEIENLIVFNPRIEIPWRSFYNLKKLSDQQLDLLCFHIGMIELISYWKATCSPTVEIKPFSLNEEQIAWWKKLYFNGLGEFFFLNKIEETENDFMKIVALSKTHLPKQHFDLKDELIIPIGGGKDSVVTLELLKNYSSKNVPMIINPRGASLNCAKIAGFERSEIIEVQRTIDQKLLELNAQGFLNGHTPFSAMLAFVSLLASAISSKKHIVLSNESSANEATDTASGVNHQYSKSYEFETDFRNYVKKYISEDFNYFSFLRPINELTIAKYFSQFPAYHEVFRSCNVGSKTDSWCLNCAKCLFAYIILSPFIEPERLAEIFGKNLLDSENLKLEFDQLIGKENVKPFECVGTTNEVTTALNMFIKQHPEDQSSLISYFKTLPYFNSNPIDITTEFSDEHHLEKQFLTYYGR